MNNQQRSELRMTCRIRLSYDESVSCLRVILTTYMYRGEYDGVYDNNMNDYVDDTGMTTITTGINVKNAFFYSKRKVGGRRKGKGEREREIESEALAETEKIDIANAPAGNRTGDPSKHG